MYRTKIKIQKEIIIVIILLSIIKIALPETNGRVSDVRKGIISIVLNK